MTSEPSKPRPTPSIQRCPRCGYSLQGLPARHACPECGLHYDEECAVYRVSNPKQLVVFWLMVIGGGWVVLKNLRNLPNLQSASAWDLVGVLAALLWLPMVAAFAWFLVRRYRRGFLVAVTADGLLVRLPAFDERVIPWAKITGAEVKDLPRHKSQVAAITLRDKSKQVEIGGVANVFPDPADVRRFVDQVNVRAAAEQTLRNAAPSG